MRKNNLTALLTDLRALILNSRPAYRDFLSEVTETKTTKILENVVLAENQLMLPVADAAFPAFIAGEAYRVVLDGKEESVVAADFSGVVVLSNVNVEDFSNPPNDYWILQLDPEEGKMIAATGGAFLGTTISVYYDETVTTQKWSVRKLAYELLPDRLLSALSAAVNTAHKALTAADAAQSTANAAQSTANAAQSTANAAQRTANAALSREHGGTVNGDVIFTNGITVNSLILPVPSSDSSSRGILFKDDASELGIAQIYFGYDASSKISRVEIGNTGYSSGEYKRGTVALNLGVNKTAISFSHDGDAYHMQCKGPLDFSFGYSEATRIPILLQGISGIIMHSSTSGSTKKFKITVDDTGTLSATEITNTTT